MSNRVMAVLRHCDVVQLWRWRCCCCWQVATVECRTWVRRCLTVLSAASRRCHIPGRGWSVWLIVVHRGVTSAEAASSVTAGSSPPLTVCTYPSLPGQMPGRV